ncbi:glycoside hydrolase family 68 protein, partial [Sphingomonas sp. CCH9-H8]
MSATEQAPMIIAAEQVTTARWTPAHLHAIRDQRHDTAPLILDGDVVRIAPDLDIWDAWPVQDADGTPSALPNGQTIWMALGAPRFPDPDTRHGHARINLILRDASGWHPLGPAMPDGFAPGSREWSGSALLASDRRTLTLFFTATGRRGEAALTFEQRLFRADATLVEEGGYRLTDWRNLCEFVVRDPSHYMASDAGSGAVGTIKAFRDPAYFRDPRDGRHHVFFAASLAGSSSAFNGAVGWTSARDDTLTEWDIRPP